MERGGGGAGWYGAYRRKERKRRKGSPSSLPPFRRPACAMSLPNPLARWRTGLPRVRLRARRWNRARLDDADRRRAGHREVHASAAGGRPAGDRGAHRALRQRRGVARSDPASGRPAGGGCRGRCMCWARPGSKPSSRRPQRCGADVVVIDSIQTVYTDTLESAPGNVGQVRECSGPAHALRQGERHRGGRGGACDQGRRHRGAQDAGAHRRHGALLRGRGHARLPAAPHHQEPVRLGRRARRLLDDRAGPGGGAQSVGGVPGGPRPAASAAARSPR